MAKYREVYITIEQFEFLQITERLYEGFVTGLGYAFVDTAMIPPPNLRGYTYIRDVPSEINVFTLVRFQFVDNSPEMVELSKRGAMQKEEYHTVKQGDTLSAIAVHFKVTVDELVKWNGIADPDKIEAGQKLIVNEPSVKHSYGRQEVLDAVNQGMGAAGTPASAIGEIFFSKTFGTWMGRNFKVYSMEWNGNQYTGGKFGFARKWGTGFKWGGYVMSGINAYFSFRQMLNSDTRSEAIIHGMDGSMSIVGMFGSYGFGISMYYFYFAKPCYPLIWQSMKDDAIRRADAAQRGSWGELTVRPGRK